MNTSVAFEGILANGTFKYLFHDEASLRDIANSYFDYVGEYKKVAFANIKTQSLIIANNKKVKDFYGDIVATLNTGEILNLEGYKKFGMNEYNKSVSYMARLYSNQVASGDYSYLENKKVISLNFMRGNFRRKNNDLINTYVLENSLTHKMIESSEMELVLINLDRLKVIPYNESEHRFITWLRIIAASSLEEIEKLVKGDKQMERSIAYVKRYLNGPLNHTFHDYVAEKEFHARKAGEEKGRKAGEENGRKVGEKNGRKAEKLTTAQKMLAKGISLEDTHEITGLPIRKLKQLVEVKQI